MTEMSDTEDRVGALESLAIWFLDTELTSLNKSEMLALQHVTENAESIGGDWIRIPLDWLIDQREVGGGASIRAFLCLFEAIFQTTDGPLWPVAE